jgi:hypothetical protein
VLDKDDPYPESRAVREHQQEIQDSMRRAGLAAGAVATAGLVTWLLTRKR